VPRIRALGITDYYSVDVYEEVLAQRKAGRLPEVDLIFPNVELRYGSGPARVRRLTSTCSYRPMIPSTSTRFDAFFAP
jgi:hypothetical protein